MAIEVRVLGVEVHPRWTMHGRVPAVLARVSISPSMSIPSAGIRRNVLT